MGRPGPAVLQGGGLSPSPAADSSACCRPYSRPYQTEKAMHTAIALSWITTYDYQSCDTSRCFDLTLLLPAPQSVYRKVCGPIATTSSRAALLLFLLSPCTRCDGEHLFYLLSA